MAARKNRGADSLPESWKEKIKAAAIIDRLNACIDGTAELSAVQVNAARILLGKVAPDLSRSDSNVKFSGKATLIIKPSGE